MARERESSDEEGETKIPRKQKQGWVQIQQNTFTNWCNEQLRPRQDIQIADLETDFEDGLKLIALVQALQTAHGKALYKMRRYSKNPKMRAQKLDNISYGLDMLVKDGVYLVNIGTEDLAECNLKLILGLIWTLILKYQISGYVGDEKKKQVVPPKKLMLAWFNAVLPDQHISNFAKDWNDGVALSGLINYCDPNQLQNWRDLDPRNSTENCREAMRIARDYYEVPQVLSPEDLSNPEVDELSGMTYLSYFVRREGPGWYATLNWVRSRVPDKNVENFDSDWNDGKVLCGLADAQGGEVPDWAELDPENKVENCATGRFRV